MKSKIVVFAIMILITAAQAAIAEPAVSGRLRKSGDRTSFYTGAGYFIPYEGDLGGAAMYAAGVETRRGGEALFVDVSFARTAPDGAPLAQNVNNYIAQFGYRKSIGSGYSIGAGAQSQQMDFGFGIKRSRLMPFVFAEKGLPGKLLLRVSASGRGSKGSVNMGGYSLMVIYK